MLTKGPAPDPKGKLNTLLILTLPHLLDCFINSRNSLFIVLLQMMGDGIGNIWLIYIRVCMGEQGVAVIFFVFLY